MQTGDRVIGKTQKRYQKCTIEKCTEIKVDKVAIFKSQYRSDNNITSFFWHLLWHIVNKIDLLCILIYASYFPFINLKKEGRL